MAKRRTLFECFFFKNFLIVMRVINYTQKCCESFLRQKSKEKLIQMGVKVAASVPTSIQTTRRRLTWRQGRAEPRIDTQSGSHASATCRNPAGLPCQLQGKPLSWPRSLSNYMRISAGKSSGIICGDIMHCNIIQAYLKIPRYTESK